MLTLEIVAVAAVAEEAVDEAVVAVAEETVAVVEAPTRLAPGATMASTNNSKVYFITFLSSLPE
jgi:hypothetical protein